MCGVCQLSVAKALLLPGLQSYRGDSAPLHARGGRLLAARLHRGTPHAARVLQPRSATHRMSSKLLLTLHLQTVTQP